MANLDMCNLLCSQAHDYVTDPSQASPFVTVTHQSHSLDIPVGSWTNYYSSSGGGGNKVYPSSPPQVLNQLRF